MATTVTKRKKSLKDGIDIPYIIGAASKKGGKGLPLDVHVDIETKLANTLLAVSAMFAGAIVTATAIKYFSK